MGRGMGSGMGRGAMCMFCMYSNTIKTVHRDLFSLLN